MEEQQLDLRGWLDYLKRKNELKGGSSIMIKASNRRVDMSVLKDRYKMGDKESIHKLSSKIVKL